jgi:drug/metabolite transporter (DMT)-like permease
MSSAFQMLFGGLVTGAIGLAAGETGRLRFASEGVLALGYLIVFGAVLAYSAYVYAIRHMPTTNMSLYAYVNPVVAVILGWLLLHEQLTVLSVAAMVIILVGVGMVQRWAH